MKGNWASRAFRNKYKAAWRAKHGRRIGPLRLFGVQVGHRYLAIVAGVLHGG